MVNLEKLTRTVKKVVDTKGDKIAAGVGKATDFVDKKTKGKYREQLEKVDDMAQKLDKTKDRRLDGQPNPEPTSKIHGRAEMLRQLIAQEGRQGKTRS